MIPRVERNKEEIDHFKRDELAAVIPTLIETRSTINQLNRIVLLSIPRYQDNTIITSYLYIEYHIRIDNFLGSNLDPVQFLKIIEF